MPSKFICGECGAENIISGFAGAGEPRRCAVCGAVQNNAASRASADSSLEPGRLESPSTPRYEEQKYNNDYRPARPDASRKLRAEPLTGKIIVALIIFTFIAVALSNKKERLYYESSKVKMCVSNMKTIEGAVALYLMENDLENKNYPPVLEVKVLVNKGYLKKEPRCPENGTYKMSLFKLDKLNLYDVSCDKHGGLINLNDKNRGL